MFTFTNNEEREALYAQYLAVNELLDTCFQRRMAAIHAGDVQGDLHYAIELDVLSTKSNMLFAQYIEPTGTHESFVTTRLAWYDERCLPVVTDYDEYLHEDVGNLPRWLADLNASLAA